MLEYLIMKHLVGCQITNTKSWWKANINAHIKTIQIKHIFLYKGEADTAQYKLTLFIGFYLNEKFHQYCCSSQIVK